MSKKILHISDLHLESFSSEDKKIESLFQEANFKSKFINKVKNNHIDYVIITGDLANKGGDNEDYKVVEKFLNELATQLNIENKNVIICPGNHDINWNKNEVKFLEEKAKTLKLKTKETKREEDAWIFHESKFEDFKEFYDSFYNDENIQFNPELAIFRKEIIDIDGFKLQICCINSCFKESFYSESHYGYIDHTSCEESLKNDYSQLPKMAILHHIPMIINNKESNFIINWENEIEFLFNQHNIEVLLFGHQHKSQTKEIDKYFELGVGSLAKKGAENTFNILTLSKNNNVLNIKKEVYKYTELECSYDWHILSDATLEKNVFETTSINDIGVPKELTKDDFLPTYEFPEVIELFSSKLLEIVKNQRLFYSGHFHWHLDTRTLGFIDTYTLLAKRENTVLAKGAILELYNNSNINTEFIIGLGQGGNVLGSILSTAKGLPFSSIPYHSREKDHCKHEWNLDLSEKKDITFVIDVICSASSIIAILEEKKEIFKDIETINLLSIFHISNTPLYNPEMFKSKDSRIKYYTVCDKIIVDKCKHSNESFSNNCSIFLNKLEKIHLFHGK